MTMKTATLKELADAFSLLVMLEKKYEQKLADAKPDDRQDVETALGCVRFTLGEVNIEILERKKECLKKI